MNDVLLSIIVPSRNRIGYLICFIDLIASFGNDEVELVVQDNSDDDTDILSHLKNVTWNGVRYYHEERKLTMTENSELAMSHATGKYVCFMGDDDLLSGKLIDFVKEMEKSGIEAALFNAASYAWPGVTFKAHRFPSLTVYNFTNRIARIDVKNEYCEALAHGANSLRRMPQLYHAVVLKSKLDEVYSLAGSYFPGPSPDMAVSIALCQTVKSLVRFDCPLISSGASPKSSAGLGAKHMHKGRLKDVPFLPKDIEKHWDNRIPLIWTGPTIYAYSAFEALKAMKKESDIEKFNFDYFYAWFFIFCFEYRKLLPDVRAKNSKSKWYRYWIYIVSIFFLRSIAYIKNIFITRFGIGAMRFDKINNAKEAQSIIDKFIGDVSIESLFMAEEQ